MASVRTDQDIAKELIDALANEILEVSSLVFEEDKPLVLRRPARWIVGTVLSLQAEAAFAWDDLVERLRETTTRSSLIYGFWQGNNAVYLHMGLGVWKSTRLDRFAGSRIRSVANNAPVVSDQRMQMIRISSSPPTNFNEIVASPQVMKEYQLMAHVLRVSLRLGPSDTGRVLGFLADHGVE